MQQENSSRDLDTELEKIKERFIEERSIWKDKIVEMAKRIKSMSELPELQVDLYTYRQEAIEYYYNLNLASIKLEKKYSKLKGKLVEEFNNKDVRYAKSDMSTLVEGASADHKHHIDIIKSHSSYFYETVKTIDNMIYGIKHRIDMENFRTSV
jgi:glycogen debranching enzyme